MTDNKPTLTRRRVLGSITTIGIAGVLGAATWAEMSDEETATVDAQAGSIDLQANGADETVTVDFGDDLANGFSETQTIDLTNAGSLPGEAMCFAVSNFTSGEGDNFEPEGDTDPANGGELDDVADLTITLSGGGASYPVYDGPANGVSSLDTCVDLEPPLEGQTFTLDIALSIPEENVNDAMGDTFSFDLAFTMFDTEQTGGGGGGA
jgi:spore coat-associated protein N